MSMLFLSTTSSFLQVPWLAVNHGCSLYRTYATERCFYQRRNFGAAFLHFISLNDGFWARPRRPAMTEIGAKQTGQRGFRSRGIESLVGCRRAPATRRNYFGKALLLQSEFPARYALTYSFTRKGQALLDRKTKQRILCYADARFSSDAPQNQKFFGSFFKKERLPFLAWITPPHSQAPHSFLDEVFNQRRNTRHNAFHPFGIRMQPICLVQTRIAGHALQEKRVENHTRTPGSAPQTPHGTARHRRRRDWAGPTSRSATPARDGPPACRGSQ